jgi:hypothetical protein
MKIISQHENKYKRLQHIYLYIWADVGGWLIVVVGASQHIADINYYYPAEQ